MADRTTPADRTRFLPFQGGTGRYHCEPLADGEWLADVIDAPDWLPAGSTEEITDGETTRLIGPRLTPRLAFRHV